MIIMEMSDEKQVNLGWINLIEVRKCFVAYEAGMNTAIKEDLLPLEFQKDARTADLSSSAERDDLEDISVDFDLLFLVHTLFFNYNGHIRYECS